ncbi:MAG: hypothetical protein V3R52_05350 [Candidatus Neomarinimicrobiota bacterium]
MKQLSKKDNQFSSLDPEKVYFVEKFGYLVKKINGGYGGPIQDALFDRINKAVNKFTSDLPNIVKKLETERQKLISNQVKLNSKAATNETYKSKSKISARAAEATRKISEKINLVENVSKDQSSSVEKKEIEIINLLVAKHSGKIAEKTSSILRPSVAEIREVQRLEYNKAMQKKKESLDTSFKRKQIKPKPKPAQELTEWERRWHKYDNDMIDGDLNGYANS